MATTTRTVFTLRIEMDNTAFVGDYERAAEFRVIAQKIGKALADGDETGRVVDSNGNTVGEWIIAEHQNLRFTR